MLASWDHRNVASQMPYTRICDGARPMHPDSVSHAFRSLAQRLGVTCRLHDLRHFMVAQLVAGGVDRRTVSGRAGHADGHVTLTPRPLPAGSGPPGCRADGVPARRPGRAHGPVGWRACEVASLGDDGGGAPRKRVVYAIVCGAPPAADVGGFVRLAQAPRPPGGTCASSPLRRDGGGSTASWTRRPSREACGNRRGRCSSRSWTGSLELCRSWPSCYG